MSNAYLIPPQIHDAVTSLGESSLDDNARLAMRQRLEVVRDYCTAALLRDTRRLEREQSRSKRKR